jgi:hypothetical protein
MYRLLLKVVRNMTALRRSSMDINKVLQQLKLEKERLELAIAQLEELQKSHVTRGNLATKRRGRKSMSEKERLEVAERMKRYWEKRRQGQPG